ncbi:MAG: hypothetical protein ACR2QF_10905, partial [Geminicoccaceae bacterium]
MAAKKLAIIFGFQTFINFNAKQGFGEISMSATFLRCLQMSLMLGGTVLGSTAFAEGLPITPGLWEIKTQNSMLDSEEVQQSCMKDAVFDP